MSFIKTLLIIIFLSGCSVVRMPHKIPVVPKKKIDTETWQKAESVLEKVEEIAKEYDLGYLGRNTMNESVEMMDIGTAVSPVLVEKLKVSQNWKFRFWIVDILGFIANKDNIIPLIEVIENNTEKEIVRLRACESLKELKYSRTIEHLLISKDMVKNRSVKEKIDETIEFLR